MPPTLKDAWNSFSTGFVDFTKKYNPFYPLFNNDADKNTQPAQATQPKQATQPAQTTSNTGNGGGFANAATKTFGNALLNGIFGNGNTDTANNGNTRKITQYYTVNADNQPYIDQLNALADQILNRKPFKYDLNGDLLYREIADQYTQLGKQAARDATGIASGLTGGYGNSYANMVGNQAYQQHLTALNNQIPSLYDKALNAWLAKGDDLMGKYQLAAQHPGTIEALKPRTYSTTVEVPDDTQGAANGIVKGYVLPTAASTAHLQKPPLQKPLYIYEDALKYYELLEK